MIEVLKEFPPSAEPGSLILTRGLPGSGKSTLARAWRDEDPGNRVIVEKDHLREMLQGGFIPGNEHLIRETSLRLVRAFLREAKTVIVPDTNLPAQSLESYLDVAEDMGVDVVVVDLTYVTATECLKRNIKRARAFSIMGRFEDKAAPDEVVLDLYERHVRGKVYPLPLDNADSL